jgi:hypothetical protein
MENVLSALVHIGVISLPVRASLYAEQGLQHFQKARWPLSTG